MADFYSTDFIKDYEDILKLVKTLTNKWDPSISDEADPGVVLIKLATLMKDKLSYKQDLSEAQAYLDTVSDRQAAFELLQMLGYVMKNKISSTGIISIRNTGDSSQDLEAFNTVFSNSDDSITFFLLPVGTAVFTIPGNSSASLRMMEGSPFDITKEGVDYFNIKDIDESGRLYLGKSGLAQNGVFIGEETETTGTYDYTKWLNIEASVLYPKDKYFFILTNSEGENYIQFPKNFETLIGAKNFKVKATYSKGAGGNISAGTLSKINVNSEVLTISQPNDIISGYNEETISQGIQNYYNTLDVFNTLVTSNDYNEAIKNIRNPEISNIPGKQNKLFSNGYARTAVDRQTKIVETYDKIVNDTLQEDQYTKYFADDEVADRVIQVVGLENADSYEDSFKLLTKYNDDALENEVKEQLDGASSIASEIKFSDDGYIRADATLNGYIMANITSKSQANEILKNIIAKLKSEYKADKLTFGKALNYGELVSNIYDSDSRIMSVSLQEPQYQVKKVYIDEEGLEKTESLTEADKLNIATEAVLEGSIPLYKFSNRSNTSNIAILNPGYINLGLGMSDYIQINKGNPYNLQIAIKDNGWSYIKNSGGELKSYNVLQLRKPIMVEDTVYGYGVRYYYQSRLTVDKDINLESNLLKGSLIKSGSIVYLDPTSTKGLVEKFEKTTTDITDSGKVIAKKVEITEDYTVLESVQILKAEGKIGTSILTKGSTIANGSLINGTVYSAPVIKNGFEHKLASNESFFVRTGSTDWVSLADGSIIKPTGLDIIASPSTSVSESNILGTSQSIALLKESKSIISNDLKYFIVTNGNHSITLGNNKNYMLEEGEFFVYSNSNLSEYIILGAGTVLSSELSSESENNIVLDNVKTSDTVSDIQLTAFKNFPSNMSSITATDMEISTFSEGYSVEYNSDITVHFGTLSQDLEIKKDGKTYKTFNKDDRYEVRLVVLIEPDEYGTFSMRPPLMTNKYSGVILELNVKNTGNNWIQLKGESGVGTYTNLLMSKYFGRLITSGEFETFSEESDGVSYAVCNYNLNTDSNVQVKNITPASMTLIIKAGKTYNIPYTGEKALIKIVGSDDITISGADPMSSNPNVYSITKGTITITNGKTDKAITVILSNLSIIADYSDELKYVESLGQTLDAEANDYFNPTKGSIEKKIKDLGKPFSWLYVPTEEFEHPTASSSYLISSHPMNYKTLPHIILDELKLADTLKILPVTNRYSK